MTGIILQATEVELVNKGGGVLSSTVLEVTPKKTGEPPPEGARAGKRKRADVWIRRLISRAKKPGADYVVFTCPAPKCGARCKRVQPEDVHLHRCHACFRQIEVRKPRKAEPAIVTPAQYAAQGRR